MATSIAEGSQTATIGVEHTLATVNTAGSYVLDVDLSNLAGGDKLILRVKKKIRSTGTTRTVYEASYIYAQSIPNVSSIPVASIHEYVVTLEQTAGTGRAFNWEVVGL